MKDWWLKFGCFLTGYNYKIVNNCSEVAAKAVKRFTAAILIVCIIWSFVGYTFAQRYLKAEAVGSIVGALVLVIIIIQVERQIILSVHKNYWLYIFRGVIAFMMALIGSIIIDQIIFKEDIEQQKLLLLDQKVQKVYPAKALELRSQIVDLDSTIRQKEVERSLLLDEITRNPTINIFTKNSSPIKLSTTTRDSLRSVTKEGIINVSSTNVSSIVNPKIGMIDPLDNQIQSIRIEKLKKDSALLTLRADVEKEIKSKVGFLDELKLMYSLLSDSAVAFFVWLIWLLFLLGIELFILVSKSMDKDNDYDATIKHQMELQLKKLALLSHNS